MRRLSKSGHRLGDIVISLLQDKEGNIANEIAIIGKIDDDGAIELCVKGSFVSNVPEDGFINVSKLIADGVIMPRAEFKTTAREWLESIQDEETRDKAICYYENALKIGDVDNEEHLLPSLYQALYHSFSFPKTNEGYEFWASIAEGYPNS